MAQSTVAISLLAWFCLIGLYLPVARSIGDDGGMVIRQITNKEASGNGNGNGNGDDEGGACWGISAPASCPINCFRVNPVCGVNGVTYWCGCQEAMCAGVGVAKLGLCVVENGGSASLPGQMLLLVHIVWMFLLGFSLLFGLF